MKLNGKQEPFVRKSLIDGNGAKVFLAAIQPSNDT